MWVPTFFKTPVVFVNKHFLVCCTSPGNFQSAEMVVFDGFDQALWLLFGKTWLINLFTFSWWKLLFEHQVCIVLSFPVWILALTSSCVCSFLSRKATGVGQGDFHSSFHLENVKFLMECRVQLINSHSGSKKIN